MHTTIQKAVAARRSELIDLTTAFCSIPAENPPGTYLVESQEWITDVLGFYEIAYEIVDSSTGGGDHRVIVGSIGDSGPVMYLHGHYDVVPAFTADQFVPSLVDGSIVGRGTADMKGGLVAMLLGAVVHRELDGDGRVRLVYVPDEESGGANGSERLAELGVVDGSECAGAIVGEPSYPDVWYAARGAFTVNVTVKGRPAHVGLHYAGTNAFEAAHHVVAELMTFKDQVAGHKTDLRIEPEAARASIMLLGGLSRGGTNYNIVPDEFSFTIDRRPNPDENYSAACRELLQLLDGLGATHDITVEVLQDVEPARVDTDHELVRSVQANILAHGQRDAALSMCPGCLETRVYDRLGIPAVAYGPGPVVAMHGPDEHVPIANLLEACAVYASVLGDHLGYRR